MSTPIGYNDDEQDLVRSSLAKHLGWACLFYEVLPSTQDCCREQLLELSASQSTPEHLCVIAAQQTDARGRQGKTWQQTAGLDLSLSFSLRTAGRYPELLLPILVAAAIFDALQPFTSTQLRIKWPNDLLADKRKICGILIEAAREDEWIVGVGINVNSSEFPLELAELATSLYLLEKIWQDRAEVLGAVLDKMASYLRAAEEGSSDSIIESFNDGLALQGKLVRVQLGDDECEGILERISPQGLELRGGFCHPLGAVTALRLSSSRE